MTRVLTIAGYDQSGGAGVLADIKTLEAHGVYGYAVCTGFTFQNEHEIRRVQWFTEQEVFEQIDLCYAAASFEWVKLGIARSPAMIGAIIAHLRQHRPGVKVVLDPVIRSSSGRDFWEGNGRGTGAGGGEGAGMSRAGRAVFEEVAASCYLLTPNWEEMRWLYPGEDPVERCQFLSRSGCHLYLKGGHNPQHPGRDHLWSNGEAQVLEPAVKASVIYPKHGSGCVLSSALAANLALGYPLCEAAVRSKRYIEQFLVSHKTLLGWHRPLETPVK